MNIPLAWAISGSVVIAMLLVILAALRSGNRYDRDGEDDALVDESQLEGDLRRELQDISFRGRS